MRINGEKRFNAIFNNAAVGIFLVDSEGRFFEANKAFCAMVGYGERQLKGMNCNEISHPDDRHLHIEFFKKLSKGEMEKYHLEKRFMHSTGEVVWVRLTFSAIRDDIDGSFLYSVAVVENITVEKSVEIRIENMLRQRMDEWNLHDAERERDKATLDSLISDIASI